MMIILLPPKIENLKRTCTLLILAIAAGLSSCGIGPTIGPYDAHSLKDNNFSLSSTVTPNFGASYSRNIYSGLDGGVHLESYAIVSAWLKQRFYEQPQGFAIAGVLGGFYGEEEYNARGFFLGPVISYKKKKWTYSISARAYSMSYTPRTTFGVDEPGRRITTDELENYGSIDMTVGYRFISNLAMRVGVRCGDDYEEELPDGVYSVKKGCTPIVGITLE